MLAKKKRRKKRDWDEIMSISLIVVLNLVIITFLIVGNWKLYLKKRDLSAQLIDLGQEVVVLEDRNQELEELFLEASQEEHLEKVIREKGMYKKPGEEVVVVLRDKTSTQVPPPQPSQDAFQRFVSFIRNLFSRD